MIDLQGNLHPLLASTIRDIFNKFDITVNNLIEIKEFKSFLEIISNPKLPQIKDENQFKDQILTKYNSND
jgi:hypothetical protein